MVPTLNSMARSLKSIEKLEPVLRVPMDDNESCFEWLLESEHLGEIEKHCQDLSFSSKDLKSAFDNVDIMLLCNLEDHIRIIVHETKEKQRSDTVLTAWDELEGELVDKHEFSKEDVSKHQTAILSFLRLILDDRSTTDGSSYQDTRSGSIGNSSMIILDSDISLAGNQQPEFEAITKENYRSRVGDSDNLFLSQPTDAPKRPIRTSVLFVDRNNTGTSVPEVSLS